MRIILLTCLMFVYAHSTWAQDRTVSGTVVDASTGESLPGVNVLLKGTGTGVNTDIDGNYKISVPSEGGTLVFTFIGMSKEEIEIGSRSVINVEMESDIRQLSEVVVTAQGIERDVKSLGYATQNVKGEDIAQKSEPNILNTLQGRITGVNITNSGGAPGSSTNINIRGITSLTGNNQPLIVIDGAIVSNATNSTETGVFASPTPNRLNDIDPETIESINVLKGPSAAVLYGSRAANGAIIITTKSGKDLNGKTEVTINSSVTFQDAILAKYQNRYGAGANNDQDGNSSLSWGPAFGTPGFENITYGATLDTTVAYVARPDNLKNFYNTGTIIQNSASMRSGSEKGSMILSLSNTEQSGIVPNTSYSRYNVAIGGETELNNGLQIDSRINYIRTNQLGSVTGNGGSAPGQLTRLPRGFDLNGLPYQDPATGRSVYFNNANNPYWSLYNNTVETQVDRVFGNFSLGYDLTDWLSVKGRVTGDAYVDRRDLITQIGAARAPAGRIENTSIFSSETNLDLFLQANKTDLFGGKWAGNILFGYNVNQRYFQDINAIGESLTIPFFNNISNASVFTSTDQDFTLQRLIGGYMSASLSYDDWAFLEVQARADKSSTLPENSNTFVYPGASLSLVWSDALNFENSPVNYLKTRFSYARVGNDANPYDLNSVFISPGFGNNVADVQFPIAGIPGFARSATIGSANLTPEFTTSYEAGIVAQFFQNRIALDASYFYNESTDQIIAVSVAPSSGYQQLVTNVGKLTNQGVELSLNARIFEAGDFKWDAIVNYTRIRNEAVELTEGVERLNVPGSYFIGVPRPTIEVGQPYGIFVGNALARNDEGRLIVNGATGTLAPTIADGIAGDPNPDWIGAIINNFSYKGFTLSAVLQTTQGGDIFSFEAADDGDRGNYEFQGENRQEAFVIDGVIDNGDGTFTENNIQLSAQDYYNSQISLATESAIFDATSYRLREASITYNFPKSLLENTPFGQASIGFSGRNLWLFAPSYPGGDPEGNSAGAGNIQGVRLNGFPQTRNYGINIRFTL